MKLTKIGTLFGTALLLVGCNDENPWVSADGEGRISPIVVTDGSVKDIVPVTRAEEVIDTPSIEEFGLTLSKTDGSFSKSWDSVADFSEDEMFPVGAYKMEASYGNPETEGFEAPYFYGSAEFEVEEGETSDVNITASLANTMVSIEYTDAFKTYFKSYSTQLHSKGGDYIVFTADETRPAYLRPGEVSLTVSLVKPNGVSGSFQPAAIQTSARHHYHILLDVNQGEVGEAELVITFDDTLTTENIVIDLSDELMLSDEPVMTIEGFVADEAFEVYECQPADGKKQFNIVADAGLGCVTMTINSAQLLAKGLPAELDLMSATPAQQALLTSLGFNVVGLWKNPDKMAFIDLSNVFKSIEGAGTHEFTIVVKDKLTKVTSPIKMVATTKAVDLSFISAENSKLGTNYADVKLNYDATGFDQYVTFEALNSTGTWVKANVLDVANVGTEYSVRLAIPDGSFDVKVRAKYCGKERDNITITRQGVTLAVSDYNVWGSKSIIDVKTIPSSTDFGSIELYVSAAGGEYVHHTNISRDATNKQITLLGLTPGTKYSVKGSDSGQYEASYPALEFTTEVAQQVGNAGFEDWNALSWDFNHNGSLGGQSSPMTYYKPWASGSSDIWWDSNVTQSLVSGLTIGYTYFKCYPLVQYSTDCHGGSRSAQITVANVGNSNSTLATIGSWYVGELLIGKGNDGSDGGWSRSSTGHSFPSRPVSVDFWYEYIPYGTDACMAEIQVKAADGTVIGSAEVSADQTVSEWTKAEVPINYTVTNKKAASIYIAFKASTSSEHSCSNGGSYLEIAGYKGDGDKYRIKLSSVLRIDDIVLNY